MKTEFIDPGSFRTELSLQQVTLTADGMGGNTEEWSVIATVFARVEPLTATAQFAAGQTLEEATHRVTLRHRANLSSGMRFVRGARVWTILSAHDPDETGRYLVCRTREKGL